MIALLNTRSTSNPGPTLAPALVYSQPRPYPQSSLPTSTLVLKLSTLRTGTPVARLPKFAGLHGRSRYQRRLLYRWKGDGPVTAQLVALVGCNELPRSERRAQKPNPSSKLNLNLNHEPKSKPTPRPHSNPQAYTNASLPTPKSTPEFGVSLNTVHAVDSPTKSPLHPSTRHQTLPRLLQARPPCTRRCAASHQTTSRSEVDSSCG